MDKKIIIASDSTCDLGAALIAEYGIKILPLTVSLGDKLYADGRTTLMGDEELMGIIESHSTALRQKRLEARK